MLLFKGHLKVLTKINTCISQCFGDKNENRLKHLTEDLQNIQPI